MVDFLQLEFLAVETKKSGDAIAFRYLVQGRGSLHVIDGGFEETGQRLVGHLLEHYDRPQHIDHVVVTHPDRDHAGGARGSLGELYHW